MKNLRLVLLACTVVAVFASGGSTLYAGVSKEQDRGERKKTIAAARASAPNPLREFRVTARDGEITPAKIKVRKGDRVRITFVSKDSTYGLKIKKYGVKRKVKAGQPVTIEFDATEEGEFPLRCSKVWGFKRWKKNGLIQVR
jgi:cytochrome c oxidase subunit 2